MKTAFLFPGQGRDKTQSQFQLFLVSSRCFQQKIDEGPLPSMVGGLSLGEIVALVAAGVLDASKAPQLVLDRQILMSEACKETNGLMAAIIGKRAKSVETICKEVEGLVVVSGYNAPEQVVISGEAKAVLNARKMACEIGYRAVTLQTNGAFHSPLMEEANNAFRLYIEQLDFNAPKIPFYSTVTGGRIDDPSEIKKALIKQMTSPVLFQQAVENMIRDGAAEFVEMEPTGVLTGLVNNIRS